MKARFAWVFVAGALVAEGGGQATATATPSTDEVLAQADAAGRPLPGVRVKVEQTRHKFLFGCNIFCWGPKEDRYRKGSDERDQAAYRSRFAALFNCATLPFYWMYYEPRPGRGSGS